MFIVEIIIILVAIILISTLFITFAKNSRKIKDASIQGELKAEKKEVDNVKKEIKSHISNDDIPNAFQEDVNKSEDVIKDVAPKEESKKTNNKRLKEKDKNSPIVLGKKSSEVYIIGDDMDDEVETMADIVANIDDEELQDINKKYSAKMRIENLDDTGKKSTSDEIKGLSKKMKTLMVSNIFSDKKGED